MSVASDLITAIEALEPAYAAAAATLSAEKRVWLHKAIGERLATAGCAALCSDPEFVHPSKVRRNGGRAGVTDVTADSFSTYVTALLA